jgi:hypothetical protein
VRELGQRYLDHIARLDVEIGELDESLRQLRRTNETSVRLQTMPGIGPITAAAIEAFAPPMATFKRGRDFAAWLGLVPRQHSTAGKPRLGRTSKMGQRDIRRLLIIGAMAVVRWAARKGAADGSWLARMLAKKPRLVVAIALANKMARSVWAMLIKGESYRGSALAAVWRPSPSVGASAMREVEERHGQTDRTGRGQEKHSFAPSLALANVICTWSAYLHTGPRRV